MLTMGIVLIFHFLVFLCLGTLVWKALKKEQFSLSFTVLIGYFCYFCLFEVLVLPMVFLQKSLTFFSNILLVVLGIVVVAGCVLGVKTWIKQLGTIPAMLKEHSLLLLILFAVAAFQCYFVAIYYDGSADAAYYVGVASTSAYTDTLGTYNPYTGEILKNFNVRYVFSCYPLHNAFVSKVTGLPAIIQAKTVMAVVNAVIANILYYHIGCALFKGKSKRYADLMVIFLFVINLYCNSIYLSASFLFHRLYEGKAVLANIIFPMILYCSLRLYQDDGDKLPWIYLFLCNLTGVTFSGSSFMAVFACSGAILPMIVLRFMKIRKELSVAGAVKQCWKWMVSWMISMMPIFCWALAYILVKLQVISLKIIPG